MTPIEQAQENSGATIAIAGVAASLGAGLVAVVKAVVGRKPVEEDKTHERLGEIMAEVTHVRSGINALVDIMDRQTDILEQLKEDRDAVKFQQAVRDAVQKLMEERREQH